MCKSHWDIWHSPVISSKRGAIIVRVEILLRLFHFLSELLMTVSRIWCVDTKYICQLHNSDLRDNSTQHATAYNYFNMIEDGCFPVQPKVPIQASRWTPSSWLGTFLALLRKSYSLLWYGGGPKSHAICNGWTERPLIKPRSNKVCECTQNEEVESVENQSKRPKNANCFHTFCAAPKGSNLKQNHSSFRSSNQS